MRQSTCSSHYCNNGDAIACTKEPGFKSNNFVEPKAFKEKDQKTTPSKVKGE
jgi:hypothetical protein